MSGGIGEYVGALRVLFDLMFDGLPEKMDAALEDVRKEFDKLSDSDKTILTNILDREMESIENDKDEKDGET